MDQVKHNPGVSLAENALEYLSYVSQLDARYLRKQGEVFTVRVTGSVVVGGPGEWLVCAVGFVSSSFSLSLPLCVVHINLPKCTFPIVEIISFTYCQGRM